MRRATLTLVVALYLVILVGLVFHSTPGAAILGRYPTKDAIVLIVLLVGFLPFVRVAAFVTRDARRLRTAALTVLVLVLGTELALRHRETRRTARHLSTYHPFLQIQGEPDSEALHSNSHGFRGKAISRDKPEGVTRVFFMGGSTVYCSTSPYRETHVRLLEKKLKRRYPERRFEVQNAGVDWYTTQHSLANYLFRLEEFDPDVVILFHGVNDLCRSFSPAGRAFGAPRSDYGHFYGPVSRWVLGRHGEVVPLPLATLNLWSDLFSDFRGPRPTRVDEFPSLAPFERNLRSIVSNLRADGVRLVLATQPSIYREGLGQAELDSLWMNRQLCETDGVFPDVASMARGMQRFNDVTRRVARETGVVLVDLAQAVSKDGAHFHDDVHYTTQGNALVAQSVFGALEEQRVFETP